MDEKTVELMKQNLISVYPKSEKWRWKVSKMKENQIFAIHQKFKQEGKFK